ncbi:16S rRNA (adenine(1518)-N(6) adenine(1519)-N(6))-dimethyltransferase [Chlorella sorokiniana]|uniref:16S rRNA (Adenine(1518)-N(6) adenine(1519)-N(6))-dimethyltransferase n=1 Tax=Chlorella sorokiniana TaxID=3076 RepID=A0A2P6TL58_CHLSO|nr:16S rRNA (adenine(1518)-N(6) adenine(1519)-N(6))-dimethyltransferase [Chlorella sorokiniana]|eukprot:PRW45021.1 16S rRNA (adenine(1518)-N(6) adenine(1519)-N(6))-dimethyltransferase [Chlorella sorokiniana]
MHSELAQGRGSLGPVVTLYQMHMAAAKLLLRFVKPDDPIVEQQRSSAAVPSAGLPLADTAAWLALLCEVATTVKGLPFRAHDCTGELLECFLAPHSSADFAAVQAAVQADAAVASSMAEALLEGWQAALAALTARGVQHGSHSSHSSHGSQAGGAATVDLAVGLLNRGFNVARLPCMLNALLGQQKRHDALRAALAAVVSEPADRLLGPPNGSQLAAWQAVQQAWYTLAVAAEGHWQSGPQRASLQTLGFRLLHRMAPHGGSRAPGSALESTGAALCEASAAVLSAQGPLDQLHAARILHFIAAELVMVVAMAPAWLLAARPELVPRMVAACKLALSKPGTPEERLAAAAVITQAALEGPQSCGAPAAERSGEQHSGLDHQLPSTHQQPERPAVRRLRGALCPGLPPEVLLDAAECS